MKLPFLLLGAALLTIVGCEKNDSQMIVLYRHSVAPGNSVVSFVSHNDGTGQYASPHCEQLRKLYESKEKIAYVCSTVVFDDFKPRIK